MSTTVARTARQASREGLRYLRHILTLRRAQRLSVVSSAERPEATSTDDQLRSAHFVPAHDGRRERGHLSGRFARTAELKILVVTSEAPPIVSGISRCVDRLTTGLRDRGHRVDVLSSVQIPRLVLGEWRFSALAAYWRGIARTLDDYDVINLHGPVPTMSDVFLMLAGARRRKPIVYTHHSALQIRGLEGACAVYNWVHRMLSGRADMILTTSNHYAQLESRPEGPPVRIVPWGVDVRPQPLKVRGDRPLRVLFVGQMRGYKGLEWLLPAVAGRPEIELSLIGDGPNRSDYEELATTLRAENVRFLGRVTDAQLHAAYDRSDVIVLPSVTQAEAFGLVTLEGMAAGCVPVVSDLPGVRDVVTGVGMVVPPRDAAGLRAALLKLADDVPLRKQLARKARLRAEGLSWDACVERYEDALFDAIHGRGDLPRTLRSRAADIRVAASRSDVRSRPVPGLLRSTETG